MATQGGGYCAGEPRLPSSCLEEAARKRQPRLSFCSTAHSQAALHFWRGRPSSQVRAASSSVVEQSMALRGSRA